ncbi:unnamed protein product, partial [Oikopleura dioica]
PGKSPIDLLEACCAAIKDERAISTGSKRKRSDSFHKSSSVEVDDSLPPTLKTSPNSSFQQPPAKKTALPENSPHSRRDVLSGSKGRLYFRSTISKVPPLRTPLGSYLSQSHADLERIYRSWQLQNSQYSLINGLSNWALYQQQLQVSLAAGHFLPSQLHSLGALPFLRNFSPALEPESLPLAQDLSPHQELLTINECRWANCSKNFKTPDALSEHVFEHVTATSKSTHSLAASAAQLSSPVNSAVSIIGSTGKLV